MPAPRFRLATLLRLRESARDDRRAQLSEALQAEELLREQSERIEEEMTFVRHEYGAAKGPGLVQVDRLMASQRYELVLKAQQDVICNQAKLLNDEIERRRLALVEADREVRVLEKLREQQREKHQAEAAREEMKLLDEVASRARQREGDLA